MRRVLESKAMPLPVADHSLEVLGLGGFRGFFLIGKVLQKSNP
jgi:hypothetical protein